MPSAQGYLKICSACRAELPVTLFHKNKAQPDGYANQCRACKETSQNKYIAKNPERHLSRHRKNRYGIDLETYQAMVDTQNSVCYICGSPPFPFRTLDMDHNHVTGTVRKLLCRGCNLALGGAKDNPETLRALANYLEEHMTTEQQPGNLVLGLSIVAEAEVIPGPKTLATPSVPRLGETYVAFLNAEHGPELVHFEETDE